MKHIDEFTIHRFRGIRDLKLEGLGQINLLVGDNNSGKTSVLEALSLYCDPLNLRKWTSVASSREAVISSLSQRDRLIWLFPQEGNDSDTAATSEILLTSSGDFSIEKVSASYELFVETISVRYPKRSEGEVGFEDRDEEVKGIKIAVSSSNRQTQPALPNVYQTMEETFVLSGNQPVRIKKQESPVLASQMINPSSHRLSSTPPLLWSDVVNAEAKSDAIQLLRYFDNRIQDIDIIIGSAEIPTISVKHEKLRRAPLSTFGDGLRRMFTLATAVPSAKEGMLLIDEVEIAIHTKALNKSFRWLVNTCVQNNVQLFITTHSLEAADAVLGACASESIDLAAYRLESGDEHTDVTRFDKGLITRLREELGLEIR